MLTKAPSAAVPVSKSKLSVAAPYHQTDAFSQRRLIARSKAVTKDLTSTVVENVAMLVLKSRLKKERGILVSVSCDAFGLLSGRVDRAHVTGLQWESPLGLTARKLEVEVGQTLIDYGALITKQRIILVKETTGRGRVLFNSKDFANFLAHPLFKAAAAKAVQALKANRGCLQGKPFLFHTTDVVILPPSDGQPGQVLFSGTWPQDGQKYNLVLTTPALSNDHAGLGQSSSHSHSSSQVSSASPSFSTFRHNRSSSPPAVQQSSTSRASSMTDSNSSVQTEAHPVTSNHPSSLMSPTQSSRSSTAAKLAGGVVVQATPVSSSIPRVCSVDLTDYLSSCLTDFFKALVIDLSGADLQFASMAVMAQSPGSSEGLLDLQLVVRVRSFPGVGF